MENPVKKINSQLVEDILPLTPMQESMLYQYLKEPESRLYFEQTCYELTGNVRLDKIKEAWGVVAAANEMLRTVFRWQETKRPVQIILKNRPLSIMEFDLSSLTGEDKQRQLLWVKARDKRKKIDLSSEPLRVILCKLEDHRYEMIVSNHHIISDGWSNVIMLKELVQAYDCIYPGKPLLKSVKSNYKEYIRWLRQQDDNTQRNYWRNFLYGFTTLTSLSPARPSSFLPGKSNAFTTVEEKRREYPLGRGLVKKIDDFSRSTGITLAILLYGIWAILLHKYNDVEDVLFGITVSGRRAPIKDIQYMVGLFINTLPLRVKVSPGEEVHKLLKRIRGILLEMEAFETTHLARIMTYSQIGVNRTLFDSVVVVQNYPVDETLYRENGHLRIALTTRSYMTRINLALGIRVFDQVILDLSYNSHIFNERSINRLSGQLLTMLEKIVDNPGKGVSELSLLKVKDITLPDQKKNQQMVFNIRENRKQLEAIEEVNFDEIF